MKYYLDIHIHSALSPCADNDMTPNNIVNMAVLKGLDIIAVTDHNSAANCEAVMRCAAKRQILAVPGMELETKEEVHVICLFPTLAQAVRMQEIAYAALPARLNEAGIFGEQILFDEDDTPIGFEKRMLLTATTLSLTQAVLTVKDMGGVAVPAHIDRNSNSLLANLGFIPEELDLLYFEVSKKCDLDMFLAKNEFLRQFRFVQTSDAHYLGDILEREKYIELDELSTFGLIRRLRRN